ncbi:hypothetical protein M231_05426 [Tremella mesenterica]|uniref:Thioredoxin domain-containing protein n=1 Tax=Tremella mesenterica TaxID=5217 RepID=A0A4Q1BI40_TREME|nr:hypothetical protein M231_05426 [Tremella mesenterica]
MLVDMEEEVNLHLPPTPQTPPYQSSTPSDTSPKTPTQNLTSAFGSFLTPPSTKQKPFSTPTFSTGPLTPSATPPITSSVNSSTTPTTPSIISPTTISPSDVEPKVLPSSNKIELKVIPSNDKIEPIEKRPPPSRQNSIRRKPLPGYLVLPNQTIPINHPFATHTPSPTSGQFVWNNSSDQNPPDGTDLSLTSKGHLSLNPPSPISAGNRDVGDIFFRPHQGGLPPPRRPKSAVLPSGRQDSFTLRPVQRSTSWVNRPRENHHRVETSSEVTVEPLKDDHLGGGSIRGDDSSGERQALKGGAEGGSSEDQMTSVVLVEFKKETTRRLSSTLPSLELAIDGSPPSVITGGQSRAEPLPRKNISTPEKKEEGLIVNLNSPVGSQHRKKSHPSMDSTPSFSIPTSLSNKRSVTLTSLAKVKTFVSPSRNTKPSSSKSSQPKPLLPTLPTHKKSQDDFSVDQIPTKSQLWEAAMCFVRDEEGQLVPFQNLFPLTGDKDHGWRDHRGNVRPHESYPPSQSTSAVPQSLSNSSLRATQNIGRQKPSSLSQAVMHNDKRPLESAGAQETTYHPPKTIVFFIRHFWCGQCQDYTLASLGLLDPEALARKNIRVVVISNGSWKIIKAYRKVFNCPFPIYVDGPRRLYGLLGMTKMTNDFGPLLHGRAAYHQSGVPGQLLRGGYNALFKFPMAKPGKLTQLGGEFILTEGFNCEFAHRMTTTSNHMEAPDVCRIAGVQHPTKAEVTNVQLAEEQRKELERLEEEMVRWKKSRKEALESIQKRRAARRGEVYTPQLDPTIVSPDADEDLEDISESHVIDNGSVRRGPEDLVSDIGPQDNAELTAVKQGLDVRVE